MPEYLPILILGAIIGVFTVIFLIAYGLEKNKKEIEDASVWIEKTREELKTRLVKKQEQEQMNQELYAYMHDIFGADVINIFDMEYMQKEK